MGLGQQVGLVARLQHGEAELADEAAGGQRLQLLPEPDRSTSRTRTEEAPEGGVQQR